MITTIKKWGNSQGIRIPKFLLNSVNWNENEKLVVLVKDGRIVIEKANSRKNIKELFDDFEGEYEPVDIDWGDIVGDEI